MNLYLLHPGQYAAAAAAAVPSASVLSAWQETGTALQNRKAFALKVGTCGRDSAGRSFPPGQEQNAPK